MNRFHIYSWRTSKHRKYVSDEHLYSSKCGVNSSDLLNHFTKDNIVDIINDKNNNQSVEVDKCEQALLYNQVLNNNQDAADICEYSDEENSTTDFFKELHFLSASSSCSRFYIFVFSP